MSWSAPGIITNISTLPRPYVINLQEAGMSDSIINFAAGFLIGSIIGFKLAALSKNSALKASLIVGPAIGLGWIFLRVAPGN